MLHMVEGRTARLKQLTANYSLYNDAAAEVGELRAAAAAELQAVARELEAFGACRSSLSGQFAQHADALLAWLEARTKAATEAYDAALAQRERKISAMEERACRLSGASTFASPARPAPPAPACAGGIPGANGHAAGGSHGGTRVAKPQLLHQRRPGGPGAPAATAGGACTPPAAVRGGGVRRAYHEMDGFGGSPGGVGGRGGSGAGVADECVTPSATQQQQQFWTPRSRIHREQEVNQMQSTLADLGKMFQQLGGLVAEQGNTIDRIDDNIEAASVNVSEAHGQLTKFQRSLAGQRGLILKTFGVLFFLIVLFFGLRGR